MGFSWTLVVALSYSFALVLSCFVPFETGHSWVGEVFGAKCIKPRGSVRSTKKTAVVIRDHNPCTWEDQEFEANTASVKLWEEEEGGKKVVAQVLWLTLVISIVVHLRQEDS